MVLSRLLSIVAPSFERLLDALQDAVDRAPLQPTEVLISVGR